MEIGYKVKLKKLKLDKDTEIKFNRDYDLSNMIRDGIPWEYGNCMILDDEDVMLSMFYRKNGSIAEEEDGAEWEGLNSFIFHVVKSKNGMYIKYLNLRGIDEKVRLYGIECMDNVAYCQQIEFGIKQKAYKNYIRNEAMKIVKIDENEFIEQIKKTKDIEYDDLEFFSSGLSEESIDYCNYINKMYFYCDDYYPEKYEPLVKIAEFILEKCNILNLNRTNLKPFKTEEKVEIMKKIIIKKIELDGGIIE